MVTAINQRYFLDCKRHTAEKLD